MLQPAACVTPRHSDARVPATACPSLAAATMCADIFKRSPEVMFRALLLHNAVIRAAKYDNCGFVLEQEGDSFTLAFYDAFDAAAFCLQVHTVWVCARVRGASLCAAVCVRRAIFAARLTPQPRALLDALMLRLCRILAHCDHSMWLHSPQRAYCCMRFGVQVQQALLTVHWPAGLDHEAPELNNSIVSRKPSSELMCLLVSCRLAHARQLCVRVTVLTRAGQQCCLRPDGCRRWPLHACCWCCRCAELQLRLSSLLASGPGTRKKQMRSAGARGRASCSCSACAAA